MPPDSPPAATPWTPVLVSLPSDPKGLRACLVAIALELGLPLDDIRLISTSLPARLPRRLDQERAGALLELIGRHGGSGRLDPAAPGPAVSCSEHVSLDADSVCSRCEAPICAVCAARSAPAVLCARCSRKKRRGRSFYQVRVGILLLVLAGVSAYAWLDFKQRRARTSWDHPVRVAIVLLRVGPVSDAATEAIGTRIPALQKRLREEMTRYRPSAFDPFTFGVYGPVDIDAPPPRPRGDGIWDLAREAYLLHGYMGDVDSRAGIDAAAFDSRVYLVVRRPSHGRSLFVEGFSENGGRIGTVDVELDESMVDFALFVTVHELFHTLGATDKYDATGRTLVPDGLAEPSLAPRFPQRKADVMARTLPVAPESERTPDKLEQLGVGPATAWEIGWSRK